MPSPPGQTASARREPPSPWTLTAARRFGATALLQACLVAGLGVAEAAGLAQGGPALLIALTLGAPAGLALLALVGRRRCGDPTPPVAPQLRRHTALLAWGGLLLAADLALAGSCMGTAVAALPLASLLLRAVYGPGESCRLLGAGADQRVSALLVVDPARGGVAETVSRRKPAWLALGGVIALGGSGAASTRRLLNEIDRHEAELLLVDGSLERLGLTGVAAIQERGVTLWSLADSLHPPARVGKLRGLAGLLWQPLPKIGLSRGRLAVKRAFDLTSVGLALPLALPLGVLIAAAVQLSSRGPAIYRQARVGAGGGMFVICKFRTMIDAAEGDGPQMAGRADPRLTWLGRHLRNSRLDELPQLWNILRGHMSVVGPRPERPVFVDEFAERIPAYHQRHLVPAGLTGLAQLNGDYASTAEEKLQADLLYATNWSILLDLALVVRTAVALAGGSLDPNWIDVEAAPEELARIRLLPAPSEAA